MPKRKAIPAIPAQMQPVIDYMVKRYQEEGKAFDYQQFFSQIIGGFIQNVMNAELENTLGYSKYDRVEKEKPNARNGSYPKTVKSSYGEINLAVPRDRSGEYSPAIVPKGVLNITGIENKVIAMYGFGASDRVISKQMEELYGITLSPSAISQITDRILPDLNAWKNRPLQRMYAYVFIDAAYFNVREDGRNVKKANYSVIGVNMLGQREVLAMCIGTSESASYWGRVLERLKARGLEDVLLFGVDGLHGMVDAIHAVFPDALVQRCIVHQLRNCFKLVPYKDRRALVQDMKLIYRAPTLDSAEQALDELEAKWGAKYPRVIKAWRDNWNELSTFYSLPVEMRRLVYTTNAIENYNRGLRKYTKNSVQFPTEQALEKHLYLAMLRIIANWHGQVYCWHRILNQLLLQFGDRILPEDLEIVM